MLQDPEENVLSLTLQYRGAQANKLQQLALQINNSEFPYFTRADKTNTFLHKSLPVFPLPMQGQTSLQFCSLLQLLLVSLST